MADDLRPQDTRAIARRIAGFRVAIGLSGPAIRLIARVGHWFCLPGGAELQRVGPTDRALLFVLSGSLAVEVDGERVALLPAGETAGEMSLLTEEPHSARLVAHRDTEVFALDKGTFERVCAACPALLRNLSILLAERLRRTTARVAHRHHGRNIALIGHDGPGTIDALAQELAAELAAQGSRTVVLRATESAREAAWYHAVESAHDVVLYAADAADTAWARIAERQADRILDVCASAPPDRDGRAVEHVWTPMPGHASAGPASTGPRHLVRAGQRADLARLARHVAGRAVGLVLSGGGARGFAHLGVVSAMRARGIPIDAVGGTSMGAIIGAGIASEWTCEELAERMRAAFVATNPISDIAIPTRAFFGGRKVRRLLQHAFGATRIEDLPVPYFCVTSDLTAGVDVAHRAGALAERLAASVALPGILPSVVLDGAVHVDGGVMNNLPVEHMAARGAQRIVAVDVSGDTALLPSGGGAPDILSILMRTGTVGNEWQRREARRRAHLLVEPPVAGVGFRDWQAFDRAVAIGRAEAERVLDGMEAVGLAA